MFERGDRAGAGSANREAAHSLRSTLIGSAFAARRAGVRHASTVARQIRIATNAMIAAFGGRTVIGRFRSAVVAVSATIVPTARPMTVNPAPFVTMSRIYVPVRIRSITRLQAICGARCADRQV